MSEPIADHSDDLVAISPAPVEAAASAADTSLIGSANADDALASKDPGLSATSLTAWLPVSPLLASDDLLVGAGTVPIATNSALDPLAASVVGSAATTTTSEPPPPPVITADAIVNVNEAVLTGTAAQNTTITVYLGDVAVGAGFADATGAWTATTAPLPAGANFLTATATDASGAVSAMSAPFDPVAGTPNAIVTENQKTGTPISVWWVNPGQDSTKLQGYTTQMGTNVGSTVQFKIDNLTGSGNYTISVYRLGYYGGDGARLITTLNHTGSVIAQPTALTNAATGEVDAGNWSVTDSWAIPSTAVSGVYVANVTQGGQVFQIPFIVSNPSDHSAILFQTADETWQAYNAWGGANLYGGNGPGYQGAAYAVSYNRPITTRDGLTVQTGNEFGSPNDMLFTAEYASIYWLEQNGYDISYISGNQVATASDDSLLLTHQVYMDAGHDEYWTDQQYANVLAARHAGVNMMFWSGNEVYWQTRFTASIDATADPNRTMVSYKDTHANTLIDPSGTATSSFMDARFASTGGFAGTPSNSLTGQLFSVDAPRDDMITLTYGQTRLSIWDNTEVQSGTAPGETASLSPGLLGYEWDSSVDNGFMPSSLIDLSSTTLLVQSKLLDYGNTTGTGTATHNLVEFRDPVSGALVFGAGTVYWSFGLDTVHDTVGAPDPAVDPSVQQAMVNEFAAMGVQPQTLQASLVLAQASTNHTPPVSTITSVSSLTPTEGQTVTVTGSATTANGVIGGVMVSSDGGATWHPASTGVGSSSVTWSYSFNAGSAGSYTLESKAIDGDVNVETPTDGVSYTVKPSTNLTIFNASDAPTVLNSNDVSSVELGMKFVSATGGEIRGIRFYKGAQNTGTHIGDLWSSTGQLLASATFASETASGWQQVNFSRPVTIQAGQSYIASYHTTSGYSYTDYYFDNVGAGKTNGSLTATGNGLNGFYAYGSGATFPGTVSFISGDNYYVDVVFNDGPQAPVASDDSGFQTAENTPLSIAASQLLANDFDPNGLAMSIVSVGAGVNGAASYNSQTQTVTFTPGANYSGPASFSYTITDADGGTSTANVSLSVTASGVTQTLFSPSSTPATITVADGNAVELGVKFTADANGQIYGIRFYKGPQNTGLHVGDLWSSTGALLATANFANETASGWQEVDFSKPVTITAGTTYVAAYHTNVGEYSVTQNYFTSNVVSGDLTAPAAGNGVYGYSASDVFPTNSYSASNYWVDAVYSKAAGPQPPVANNDSGFVTSANIALAIAGSQLLANDTDPNGLAMSITGVTSGTGGTASYNAQTNTVNFTPTTNYVGAANFTYSITDAGGGTSSASVSVTITSSAPTETLFSASSTPATVTVADGSAVELGVKFTADANGYINGIRFYKGPQNTGVHIGDLWSSTGALLATASFANETASGWQQVNFSSPVAITAGTTYVAAYHTSVGEYSVTQNYFTSNVVSGDLTAPAAGNGVYAYGASDLFPSSTYSSSNYWVDAVYSKATGPQPPIANNDSGFSTPENTALTINASQLLANDTDPNGLAMSITGVTSGSGGAASYNSQTKTVTFTPTANYFGAANFTYSITDADGGVASANVSLSVTNPNPTVSLFSSTYTPSIVTVADSNAVELGVKFTSSQAGSIVGIRFYKGAQNTGAHVADLWSSTGTKLATVNFTNETASGWQEADFASPVSILANTTYVAAYHTNVGEYSADPNFFANPLTSAPLTAPSSSASGGNGVYAYGATDLFPNNSYNSTSYGVDVVFKS